VLPAPLIVVPDVLDCEAPAVAAAVTARKATAPTSADLRRKLRYFGMDLSPPLGFEAKVRPVPRRVGYGAVAKW
jgi:hypothetical protein